MKAKRSVLIVCIIILFCGMILAALHYENVRNEKTILETYSLGQEKTVKDIISSAGQDDLFEKQAAELLQERIETSASVYGCVTRDGEIVFLRDESATSAWNGKTFQQEFGRLPNNQGTLSAEANHTFQSATANGEKCLVSIEYKTTGGHVYGVGIISYENYVLRRFGVDLAERDLLILILLPEFALLFSVSFLLNRLGGVKQTAVQFYQKVKEDRFNFDKLNENLKKSKGTSVRQTLCSKDVLLTVIRNLTGQQKNSARMLKIKLLPNDRTFREKIEEIFAELGDENCIACLDDEEDGLILLLNTTEKNALVWKKYLQDKLLQDMGKRFEIIIEMLP